MSQPCEQAYPHDIIIVWLDKSITDSTQYLKLQRKNILLSCVRSAHPFMDMKMCEDYIKKMSNYRVIIIVSGSLGQRFIPDIHELPHVSYIYIYCYDIGVHRIWSESWAKVRGVYSEENDLFSSLEADLRSLKDVDFPFGLFEPSQRSIKDLTTEKATFMWSQLIIEVLIRLKKSLNAKSEMIAECRVNYKDNRIQLEDIDLFEKTYRECDAIKWYTRNGFLFHLFNKAFRQQNFEIIFKYRFYLLDLYSQIECLYKEQIRNSQNRVIVYRGQMMSKIELIKLRQNIGSLISINTFFSTSFSSAVAVSFCGNGEYESYGIASVMFEIDIDVTAPNRPFACIENSSIIQDEREVLFSIGTVFLVEFVELETDTIWLVKLVWNHETNEKLQKTNQLLRIFDSYASRRIGDNPSTLAFGYILSQMGLLREALRFYIYLCKTLPADHEDRGALYNNLGEVFRKLNYYNRARYQYEKALDFCMDNMLFYHPFWAIVHSNIGLLNFECGNPKEALKSYHCAAFLLSRCMQLDERNSLNYVREALATIYHGMGAAWVCLDNYINAINCYKKAINMENNIFPEYHPTFIDSFHKLAFLYMKSKRYTDALATYEIVLDIAQHNLIEKDKRYISLHLDMAYLRLYFERNESKALEHCNLAREVLSQNDTNKYNPSYTEYYKKLAAFYLQLKIPTIPLDMWMRCIEIYKLHFLSTRSIDLEEIQSHISEGVVPDNSKLYSKDYILVHVDKIPKFTFISMLENICCEFADQYRKSGYIKRAIFCYVYLLENKSKSNNEFDDILISRLHNNLAACYQDLNENEKALFHYKTSLRGLVTGDEKYNLLTSIVNYNIALVYIELDNLVLAQQHLYESLAQYELCSKKHVDIINVKVYRQLIRVFKKRGNFQMVHTCYQYILNQMKLDGVPQTLIQKYEKFAQNTLEDMRID